MLLFVWYCIIYIYLYLYMYTYWYKYTYRIRQYVLICLSCDVHIHVAIHMHIFIFGYIYIDFFVIYLQIHIYIYIHTHVFLICRERWFFACILLHVRYYNFTWDVRFCRHLYGVPVVMALGCSPRMKPTPWDLMNQLEESMLWTWAWHLYLNVLLSPQPIFDHEDYTSISEHDISGA